MTPWGVIMRWGLLMGKLTLMHMFLAERFPTMRRQRMDDIVDESEALISRIQWPMLGGMTMASEVRMPGIAKLVEELGELQQVLGKALQLGSLGEHWGGSDLKLRAEEEIGDVHAALMFFSAKNFLGVEPINDRWAMKATLFEQWHREGTMR